MNDCNFCRYIQNEVNHEKQSCSKWVNKDDYDLPCTPTNGNPGDQPNEGDNCLKVNCPSHCQFPFTKEIYKDPTDNHYDVFGVLPDYRYLNENPNDLDQYIEYSTSHENIKNEYINYDNENVPSDLNLKCGELLTPEEGNIFNFPELPNSEGLRQTITYNIELLNKGIDWSTIKRTDKFNDLYNEEINSIENTVTINDYTIELSDNGIELEWWDKTKLSEEELKKPLPPTLMEYQNLENIHQITGGVLEYVFPNHSVNNMVIEEVYDWLMKNDIESEVNQEQMESIQNKQFTMSQFFGISQNDVLNRDFEICMNQLMTTEHDDNEYLKRINTYTHLSELGDPNNKKDLLYVEAKILKFLIIDPSDIRDCFNIVYLTDEICKRGLTSNATQLMGYFLKLSTDNVNDEKYNDNMRIITVRLLKYLPDIINKIIEIAEYYESQKCNQEIHRNTKLLKEIYNSLFQEQLITIDLPSLGMSDFFRDFKENIYTKIILLIFVAYLITQFIKLFTINVNLGK
tara:strand:- start:2282 stop:3826 length:1545 start_codon:yes stop_codon:yes gene_type:complete